MTKRRPYLELVNQRKPHILREDVRPGCLGVDLRVDVVAEARSGVDAETSSEVELVPHAQLLVEVEAAVEHLDIIFEGGDHRRGVEVEGAGESEGLALRVDDALFLAEALQADGQLGPERAPRTLPAVGRAGIHRNRGKGPVPSVELTRGLARGEPDGLEPALLVGTVVGTHVELGGQGVEDVPARAGGKDESVDRLRDVGQEEDLQRLMQVGRTREEERVADLEGRQRIGDRRSVVETVEVVADVAAREFQSEILAERRLQTAAQVVVGAAVVGLGAGPVF